MRYIYTTFMTESEVMMERTATLNLRVSPEVKAEAESVLSQLGISMSTAVTMFLRQVALTGGIPFVPQLPRAPRSIDVDAMDDAQLARLLSERLEQAQNGSTVPLADAAARLRE